MSAYLLDLMKAMVDKDLSNTAGLALSRMVLERALALHADEPALITKACLDATFDSGTPVTPAIAEELDEVAKEIFKAIDVIKEYAKANSFSYPNAFAVYSFMSLIRKENGIDIGQAYQSAKYVQDQGPNDIGTFEIKRRIVKSLIEQHGVEPGLAELSAARMNILVNTVSEDEAQQVADLTAKAFWQISKSLWAVRGVDVKVAAMSLAWQMKYME